MSSKPSTSKDTIKSNTILTRNKSNLMKRQLRNKDESVRRISEMTQLLLGPTKEKTQKSPQKPKKVKSPKAKGERNKSEERSPKKTQKKPKVKKMLLKPKYDLKSIGRKRKMALPKKAGPDPPKRLKRARSPTIQELIRMTEDQDLDDEDLMEILTCDSPVWWEDPPEPSYIEDAISTKLVTEQNSDSEGQEPSVSPKPTHTDEMQTTNITIPANKQSDPRFMNKRTKLESLLGNIKNKTTKAENKGVIDTGSKNEHFGKYIKTEDNPTIKNVIHAVIYQHLKEEKDPDTSAEVETEKKIIENIKSEIKEKDKLDEKDRSEIGSKRSKTSSTSTDDDPFLALRNDDLLNDLQNMNIPVEHDGCSIGDDIARNTEEIKLKKDNPDSGADKVTSKRNLSGNESRFTTLIKKEDTKNVLSTAESAVDKSNDSFNENKRIFLGKAKNYNKNALCGIEPIVVGRESKDIVQIHFIDTTTDDKCYTKFEMPRSTFNITSIEKSSSSPISFHSVDTDATSASNLDAISDTNIQFIEDCASIKTCDTTDNEVCNSSKSDKTNENGSEGLKSESKPISKSLIKEHLRAVYKTITSNITEKDELKTNQNSTLKDKTLNELDSTSSLDSFYKKCKTGNQKPKQKIENNNEMNTEAKSEMKSETNTGNLKENKNSPCPKCSNHSDTDNTKNIVPIEKSAKYCLKCSSIFETETCTYCTKKEKLNNKKYQCNCSTKQT